MPDDAGRATIRIAFSGYWLSGTGAARGRDVDDVAYRDPAGCPAMPMTQVKGQLRETAERLARDEKAGWNEARVALLFGEATAGAGALGFRGEARLPDPVRAWFMQDIPEARSARGQLFRRVASTRVNSDGVAEDKTMRAIEVAVPMTIEGTIEWRDARTPDFDWRQLLDAACAATLAFGKFKTDGYGRAVAQCLEAPELNP